MNKDQRHQLIKSIVKSTLVRRQSDLVSELRRRGVRVTQATVSRDVADIPLQRVRRSNAFVYDYRIETEAPLERLRDIVSEFVQSIDVSGNLVVLKTAPGTAQTVAASLDRVGVDGVMGTVAGDDTILVVAKTASAGKSAKQVLSELLL